MSSNNFEILFFLPKKTMNEATIYYVDIVKSAFEKANYQVIESENIEDVKKYKKIFVMSAKWCFLVKIRNPFAKIVVWFQGLGGEEILMASGSKIGRLLWGGVEYFTLKFSWINIYVSERMRKYYNETYKVTDKNYLIMPCFNKELNKDSFSVFDKYEKPTFVYAGGLSKWQCIEETLYLYSLIEGRLVGSSLTLLTKDKVRANELLTKYNIKNSQVKFIPLEDLDDELKKYKYGFLIREDHIVNNVSTPTKMNSYLANGIIPIYTNVIDSFNLNLPYKQFILLDYKAEVELWANQVIFEEKNSYRCLEEYKREVIGLFSDYYSKSKYIDFFSQKITQLDK